MISSQDQDPRYEFCKTAPVLAAQISAIVRDPVSLEWFRSNGVELSSFHKIVEGLAEIAEAYKKYSEFLGTIIDRNQKH